jgi:hypothetical protein
MATTAAQHKDRISAAQLALLDATRKAADEEDSERALAFAQAYACITHPER